MCRAIARMGSGPFTPDLCKSQVTAPPLAAAWRRNPNSCIEPEGRRAEWAAAWLEVLRIAFTIARLSEPDVWCAYSTRTAHCSFVEYPALGVMGFYFVTSFGAMAPKF